MSIEDPDAWIACRWNIARLAERATTAASARPASRRRRRCSKPSSAERAQYPAGPPPPPNSAREVGKFLAEQRRKRHVPAHAAYRFIGLNRIAGDLPKQS